MVFGGALDLFHMDFIGLDWNLSNSIGLDWIKMDPIGFHWITLVYNGQHMIWLDLDQNKRNILILKKKVLLKLQIAFSFVLMPKISS